MGPGRRRDLRVGAVVRQRVDGRVRVTSSVEGVPVWFDSSDAEAVPAVEAFAGPFVLAALERGVRLRLGRRLRKTGRHVRRLLHRHPR